MTDYTKSTVVQLRDIFKARGAATTGLTRKQQLIDRLLELDAAEQVDVDGGEGGDESGDVMAGMEKENEIGIEGSEAGGEEKAVLVERTYGVDTVAAQEAVDNRVNNAEQDDAPAVVIPAVDVLVADAPAVDVPAFDAPAVGISVNNTPVDAPDDDAPVEDAPRANAIDVGAQALPTTEETIVESTIVPSKEIIGETTLATGASEPGSATSPSPTQDADSKKRKRRSATPPLLETEVAAKKARQEEDTHERPAVLLREDLKALDSPPQIVVPALEFQEASDMHIDMPTAKLSSSTIATKPPQSLYKDLLSPTQEPIQLTASKTEEPPTAPSLHPATPALYISNLMRPLKDLALKTHLATLSLPPSSTSSINNPLDSNMLVPTFYLDAIKATAFAIFPSTAAATRVRTALHERTYPAEANRKALFVDFVPEESVAPWISTMNASAREVKRWEVIYERDANGELRAELRVGGAVPARNHSIVDAKDMSTIPTGPAADRKPALQQHTQPTPASFTALSALFESTTAKPMLYFLPVPNSAAEKRLDLLDRRSARGVSGHAGPMTRFTFEREVDEEDKEVLVNGGPEFGMRGAGRGGGGGRGRGWRNGGDSYRGGGRGGMRDRDASGREEFGGRSGYAVRGRYRD